MHIPHPNQPVAFDAVPQIILHIQVDGVGAVIQIDSTASSLQTNDSEVRNVAKRKMALISLISSSPRINQIDTGQNGTLNFRFQRPSRVTER
jgi:hypothetical protein